MCTCLKKNKIVAKSLEQTSGIDFIGVVYINTNSFWSLRNNSGSNNNRHRRRRRRNGY